MQRGGPAIGAVGAAIFAAQPLSLPRRSFGVLQTRAERVLVPGRLRQVRGFGSIMLVDLPLTGQVPMLLRPRIQRHVVHSDPSGAGPRGTGNVDLRCTVKAS